MQLKSSKNRQLLERAWLDTTETGVSIQPVAVEQPILRRGLDITKLDSRRIDAPNLLDWLGIDNNSHSVVSVLAGNNRFGGRSSVAINSARAAAEQGFRVLLVETAASDSALTAMVSHAFHGWRNKVNLSGFLQTIQGVDLALDDAETGQDLPRLKRILRLSSQYDAVVFDGLFNGLAGELLVDGLDRLVLVKQSGENTAFIQRGLAWALQDTPERFSGIVELTEETAPQELKRAG